MLNFPTNFEKLTNLKIYFLPRKMKNGKFWKNQKKKIVNFVKSLKNRQIQTNLDKYILPREMKYEKI